MDFKALAIGSATALLAGSFATLAALVWWPAWFIVVALWLASLTVLCRQWKSDQPAREPLDYV